MNAAEFYIVKYDFPKYSQRFLVNTSFNSIWSAFGGLFSGGITGEFECRDRGFKETGCNVKRYNHDTCAIYFCCSDVHITH